MLKTGTRTSKYFNFYGSKEAGYEKMKDHGYDCCDYNLSPDGEYFNLNDADMENFFKCEKALANKYGIIVNQVHSPWPIDDTLPGAFEKKVEIMKKSLKITKYLGSKYLVLHPHMPYGHDFEPSPQAGIDANIEFFGELLETAKELDIYLCIENLPMRSPYAVMCLDTGHALVYPRTLKNAIETAGSHIKVLHVHDNNRDRDSHMIPGKGAGDWEGFVQGLKNIGYEGVISIEADAHNENEYKELADIAARFAQLAEKEH